MKQKDYPAIADTIERKAQLQLELEKTDKATYPLSNQIDRITLELREARAGIQGLQNAAEKEIKEEATRGDSRGNTQHFQGRLANQRIKINALDADLSRATGEMAELKARMVDLKTQIIACDSAVSLATVLAHQNTIAPTQSELTQLQQLIADQQRVIAETSDHKNTVAPLIGHREELLADIALGADKAAELAQLDRKIEVLQKEQDNSLALNQKTIAHARQTISGLDRRQASVQEKLNQLNRLTPKILDLFVMTKAMQTADEFAALADQLVKKMLELLALDALVADFGQRSNSGLFGGDDNRLTIPCINGVKPLESIKGADGTRVTIVRGFAPIAEPIAKIKQDMINQGVNI